MRSVAFITLLATLGAAVVASAVRPAEASALRRAYFRVETPDARHRLAAFESRELPGGIIAATVPPAMIPTFSASAGITFLGYEALYRPAPVGAEEPGAEGAPPQTAADVRRPCWPPGTPPVGWGIKAMYDDPNLVQPSGGAGVKVGVIDTGVFPHLDIVRRLVKCMDLTRSDLLPACADSMNHGTMVASIIAADGGADGLGMWGMAPEASIYSYRVCEPNRECWGAYVADAVYAAIADSVNIINMSLEGPGNDDAVRAAIDEAVARNILLVVSAGNSPPYSYVGYPAAYPEVVSVGAITESLQPWLYTTSGLNDGDYVREANEVEMAAPGEKVLVATKHGCWGLLAGTSLAAPMVAGLAAKLWNGNAAATRASMQLGARLHDLYIAGDDTLTGFGLPTATTFRIITATAGAGGTVSPGGYVPVAPGTSQTFRITPANCFGIVDVKVDGVSQGPIASYTFSDPEADHTITATFTALGPYTITANGGTGGTIAPNGVKTLLCGAGQLYTIAPAGSCYATEDVVVDGVSRGPITSYLFTNVRANHTIQASFRPLTQNPGPFVIQADAEPGGTISPGGAYTAACGTNRTFTITPAACYRIKEVIVDGVSKGVISTYSFANVQADHTIQASFAPIGPFTLSASWSTGGTISPGGVTSVACGTTRTYTITPDNCRGISVVRVDGVSVGAVSSYTFTNVKVNHTISADFVPRGPYTITAVQPSGGSISPVGTTSVTCGSNMTYAISPSDNCHAIQNVRVDGVSQGIITSYTFTNVTGSHSISATFITIGTVTIAASAGPGGSITPSGSSGAPCNSTRTYTITPADYCHVIQDVKVDGVSRGPISNYTFTGLNANHTIEATFYQLAYAIDAGAGPGGSISPGGASTVACGGGATYVIAPADHCHVIQDVKVDGVSRGPISSYTFTSVVSNRSIQATFAELGPFTITAAAGAGGTIGPGGAASAPCGVSRSYAIAPADKCHVIQDVKVDGVSKGPIGDYTFTDLTSDHTIEAAFATLGPFTIEANAGVGASITPSGATTMACGGSVSYAITPADACRLIADVQVDGASVGTPAVYTFSDLHSDHTIAAASAPSSLVLAEMHSGASWGGLADGTIDLTVSGGVPPYIFSWSNGATSEDVAALAAGTYDVRVTDAQGCVNDLRVTIANVAPGDLAMSAAAPNPTPGPLRLRYGIPAGAAVRLSVLDLQGREVAVLAQGSQPAGWSWASWNGETGSGRAPGGVYFIRLQAGSRQIVQRFALVR